MAIKTVAQGCQAGNQAEFTSIPIYNTIQQKNLVLTNFSRSEQLIQDYFKTHMY